MTRNNPEVEEADENDLEVDKPKSWAAGIPGVVHSMQPALKHMGVPILPTTARVTALVSAPLTGPVDLIWMVVPGTGLGLAIALEDARLHGAIARPCVRHTQTPRHRTAR